MFLHHIWDSLGQKNIKCHLQCYASISHLSMLYTLYFANRKLNFQLAKIFVNV